ncbi:hypothetical protein [Tenacibaculum xiamenense]|uniref:hypothetical protein n=1 Tax=Tenacibaculum xiamenense TaxID=1261553 RepID=UPI003894A3BA
MKDVFKQFYKDCYIKTQGFIPSKPIEQHLFPGDFFQIKNGNIVVLGNIFKGKLIAAEEISFINGMSINQSDWAFNHSVSKTYSGREVGESKLQGEFNYSKQVISFNGYGSFYFKAVGPEVVKINNWNQIAEELIIKLTQTIYSFREVYVVTDVATASHWTLAVGGDENAELEIVTEQENFGLVDIFGNGNSQTIQARHIEYYHEETNRKPSFFKAKKLVVNPRQLDVFVSDLIAKQSSRSSWVKDFYDYDFNHDSIDFSSSAPYVSSQNILDMLQANQLNPNTALLYFDWAETSLDDVQKLFNTVL